MLEIYITDLAAYNSGYLIGEWVELPLSEEELASKIQEILGKGAKLTGEAEHEEWFITDYSWLGIDLMEIDEYENIHELNKNLQLIQECNKYQLKAIRFLLSEGITLDLEDAFYRSDDVYIHENMSMEEIAIELLEECYGVDKLAPIIANNIDYYSIGQELEMDGNYTVLGRDVYEYIG